MQRAGAMNLLSFLLNDMTEENRKLSIDVNVQIERVVASISDTELLDKITECVKIQIGAYEKYN